MSKPYFLIDFENVQPKALDRLRPGSARVKVFLGEHQTRLMLDLVQALQPFGGDAQYIAINGSGPDAVDFHIAFYIGLLAAAEPDAVFNIISKDRGFDPLVRHLTGLGIACQRWPEIPGAATASTPANAAPAKAVAKAARKPAAKKAAAKKATATKLTLTAAPGADDATNAKTAAPLNPRVAEVVAHLRKSSKPTTVKRLRAAITSWIKPTPDDKAVNAIMQSLQSSRTIVVTGTKVAYTLA